MTSTKTKQPKEPKQQNEGRRYRDIPVTPESYERLQQFRRIESARQNRNLSNDDIVTMMLDYWGEGPRD